MTRLFEAVIFDFDGVLVDSNPIAERHWARWAKHHGIPENDVLSIHHGRPTAETIRAVAPHLDIAAEALAKETAEADDTDGLTRYPGAIELINALPRDQWAIATSGTRRTATNRMQFVGIPAPKVLVTANDVKNGKPAPEPYLLAAKQLDIDIAKCAVLEDAPAGIRSAKSAGAFVIGVASTNNTDALSEADVILPELNALQLKITENNQIELEILTHKL